jgi:glycosyltransferase involved in cell wall biosynthesis
MPIKVLHVTFDMTIGGTQQVIRQLVENMDESKVQSEIVCIDGRLGELGEILQEQGVSLHILKRQLGFDTSLIKALYHLIKANQYDVVHCHQYTPYVYGLIASILTKAEVIFTEHGRFYPDYGTLKRQLINPLMSLFTCKITAISKATKDALVKFEHFKEKDIEVIYNGIVDNSQLEFNKLTIKKQLDIPEQYLVLGTISRLQPIKNQTMMIRAFQRVQCKYKNIHLLIVGDGKIKPVLEVLVNELGLNQSVTFTGFQQNSYRYHQVIDVFLLPSFSEGASMTLLEAMSFSKPSVVTDVGGNSELVKNNITGFVVESNNLNNYSDALMQMLSDSDLRISFGNSAKKRFEKYFSIDRMINSFTQLYISNAKKSSK